MKQIFLGLFCIAIAASLLAQEKYPTPTIPLDQKFNRSVNQIWALTAAGINQAKANGISPYDYGRSIGKLYAPTWGNRDFDGFVKGMLGNFEYLRTPQEKPAVAKVNPDGSVALITDDKVMHTYFDRKPFNVNYEECLQYFNGILDVFASDIIHGKATYEHQDSVLVTTIRRQ
jgi:hypothetical protein